MSARLKIAAATILSFWCLTSCANVGGRQVLFDVRADFRRLHHEVLVSSAFREWTAGHNFGNWRELPRTADGKQVVIVQADDANDPKKSFTLADMAVEPVFAAEVQYAGANARVLRTLAFASNDVFTAFQQAELDLRAKTKKEITVAQPVVNFESRTISWDLEATTVPSTVPVAFHDCAVPGDDSTASDELHHKEDEILKQKANDAIKNISGIDDQAAALCLLVKGVPYNTFFMFRLFTASDLLVQSNGGVCDEKAVLLTTYLRIVGIPARMKFLKWQRNGKEEQHACVEYISGNVVHHLDPTTGLCDHPEHYRKDDVDEFGYSPQYIKVVDVDWPADARSGSDINGHPDKDGDGYLNPWGDFCYTPDVYGEARTGYSCDPVLPMGLPCPPQ